MICHSETMPVKKDFTQIALDAVRKATGEVTAPAPSKKAESGRKGGLKGGQGANGCFDRRPTHYALAERHCRA